MTDRPNILYLHSHDTGRYIQPYGHAVDTPHLQKLASQGILFRQNFSTAPTCSPSRAGLLTGMFPHNNGMTGLAHRGWRLNDYRHHLLHTLRQAGYYSALFGTQHIVSHDQVTEIGYDLALPGGSAEERTQAAVDFLLDAPSQPFFASIGFNETHRPFPTSDPNGGNFVEDPRYVRPAAILPDTPQTRQDMADFNASVQFLDACYGRVLQALDKAGIAENTLVICTTDHGIAFPGMKCNLTDHGIGVLLILRGPGEFSGGKVIDSLVSHLDIFPTLCDYLGLAPPPWLQGTSLVPLIREEVNQIRDEVFAEVNYHAAYEPQRCVRTRRYKYIRRFDGRETVVLPNCDDSPSKDIWLQADWAERAQPQEYLFDLVFDPQEVCNLAADAGMQPVLVEMRAKLHAWMQQTDDPLLSGPLPAPPGAVANHPDAISPEGPIWPVDQMSSRKELP
jgi:N-sulfoglucosamine sulfohydrolase